MESEDMPGKDKPMGKGSRKKREPQPPLQPDLPAEEGVPTTGKVRAPASARASDKGPEAKAGKDTRGAKVLRAADVMTEDPVCCVPETPLGKVARLMAENSCGAIPVIRSAEDRTPLGMVTDRDVAVRTVAEGRNPLELTAADVMTHAPVTVSPEDPVEDCAALMRGHQVRRLVVVDGRGRVAGLLVLAQIARHLPHSVSGETVRDISRPPQEG